MDRRRHTALGIADALLVGAPDATGARERCERALGSRARWIRALAQQMVEMFADNWRDSMRHDMARAIGQSHAFSEAWQAARPPRLRSFVLTPPRMASLPPALSDCVVPDLPTPGDLARWLKLDWRTLNWLTGPLQRPQAERPCAVHYSYRWLPKRSGGVRLLEVPKAHLRAVQRRLLHGLLRYVPPHEAVHGFRERHSCVTNARIHVGKAVVMRMDLQDFFAHIGGGKVYALFSTLGYPAAAARVLTRLTTCATPPHVWEHASALSDVANVDLRSLDWHTRKRLAAAHLPQGAPSSPVLANLCAFNFDVRVQALAEKFGLSYTRYADDLTFSGGEELARRWRSFEVRIGAIALEEGLRVNHRKTRLMRAAARQRVTGVVVNRVPNIPREQYDRLKATLHNCVRHGPGSQSTSSPAQFRQQIAGHIAHVTAIHPLRGARLRKLYEQVRWPESATL